MGGWVGGLDVGWVGGWVSGWDVGLVSGYPSDIWANLSLTGAGTATWIDLGNLVKNNYYKKLFQSRHFWLTNS